MKKLMLAVAAVLMSLPASAAGYYIRGGFGYGPWYGPGYWGGPGYYAPYAFGTPNAGQLKLDTKFKDAAGFINGPFAGKASKLKSNYLRPRAYNLHLRAPALS